MSSEPPIDSTEKEVSGAPLLKWPGGKRALLKNILSLVPSSFGIYYEPFAGGAALFFALRPTSAILGDSNKELVNCYKQVRDNPDRLIARLQRMKNSEQDYYGVRASRPRRDVGRAARLIYLTTLSFNGIHRTNLRGEFNVPYGYKLHLRPCDPSKVLSASVALSQVELRCEDFETAVDDARKDDLVYLDPPYTVAHGNNGFLKYNDKIFSWDDQVRLSELARNLVKRGCFVIVSNAHHPSILSLYKSFELRKVKRPSVIAASGEFRRIITECIFYSRNSQKC